MSSRYAASERRRADAVQEIDEQIAESKEHAEMFKAVLDKLAA